MGFPYSLPFPFGDPRETAETYAAQLVKLLPPGRVWDLEPDSTLRKTFLGIADELARIAARGRDLLDESDPRIALETLDDWERALGLPDSLTPVLPTGAAERRAVIVDKLTAIGGQNLAFFEDFCLACGYPLISITKNHGLLLRVGARVGGRCYGPIWSFMMLVRVGTPAVGALTRPQFERAIRDVTHAHITVTFQYG